MRIAYFTESLPPLTDGVARTFTRLAETLNAEKADFLFFSPVLPPASDPWRGRVIQVPSFPFPLYDYYRVGIPFAPRLDSILNRFQPDLVHVASPTPLSLYGQNYAFRKKIPSVASYHTHFTHYMGYYGLGSAVKWGWRFLKWFHNRSRLTFAPSPGCAAELIQQGLRGVQIWPRGIDEKKFSPSFRNEDLRLGWKKNSEPVFLFVGRLVKEKNLSDLVQAALLLRKKGCRFRLAFAGDGPFRPYLEKFLPGDLFLGFREGAELSEIYASADLFVFPSTTETFGNVILEAFASGLPVVAVDQGGSSDLIQSGENGLLARPHDPADFARQIQTLLDQPSLRTRLKDGALATTKSYHWPTINRRLLSQCASLLERTRETAGAPRKKHFLSARAAARFANRRFGWRAARA